jgi:hypothetical protein
VEAFLGALPQLVEVVQKGGVVGVMLIVTAVLAWEVWRLRKENTRIYGQRDKWRTGFTICKAALDFNRIPVDLSAMQDVLKEDAA